MQNKNLKCSLHNEPFSLYCDQCLQLICHKCTILGPHNSAVHSVCQLPKAYQRRVQQLSTRLNNLIQNRDHILNEIGFLISCIENLKTRKVQIDSQNQKVQSKIQVNLNKALENIAHTITKTQEDIYDQINSINDLGHQFQSRQQHIETIITYPKIIDQMKQVSDALHLLLKQSPEAVIVTQLPKQLTQMRIKIKQIDTLQSIYQKKQQVLKSIICSLQNDLKKIQTPHIDYNGYLTQLNEHLTRFEKKGLICYFCGIIMDDQSINTICQKNQLNQQINKISYDRGLNGAMLDGYGQTKPDNSRFGSHRHYFCEPQNQFKYYREVFLRQITKQTQNEQSIKTLQKQIDPGYNIVDGQIGKTIYTNYLNILFVKIKTLQKMKLKNLKILLEKQDTKKNGCCDKIGLQYILIELIGLTEYETTIIKHILQKKSDPQLYNFQILLNKLQSFFI